MRKHLEQCFRYGKIDFFPKISKMPVGNTKKQKIAMHCFCRLPEAIDDLVRCDRKNSSMGWYHKGCIIESTKGASICENCRQSG